MTKRQRLRAYLRGKAHARFRAWWRLLAGRGEADGIDGAEYRRLYQEWVDAGRPASIGRFLRESLGIWPRGGRS